MSTRQTQFGPEVPQQLPVKVFLYKTSETKKGKKETWLVVAEEKSRLLLRKQKVFQHKYYRLDKVAVVHCFHQKRRKRSDFFYILNCNLKRGLRALKTLSFICSGQWKVEKGLLVMFSVERRNFNGQFFRFLWPTKISSKISNTPQQTEGIKVG